MMSPKDAAESLTEDTESMTPLQRIICSKKGNYRFKFTIPEQLKGYLLYPSGYKKAGEPVDEKVIEEPLDGKTVSAIRERADTLNALWDKQLELAEERRHFNTLPTFEDICTHPLDLDQQSAIRHFLGKNLDEAYDFFCEQALYCSSLDDFYFMGEEGFIYYLPIVTRYLKTSSIYRDSVLSQLDSIIGFRPRTFLNHPVEMNQFIKEFKEAKARFNERADEDEDGEIRKQFEKVDLSIEVFLLLQEAGDKIAKE